MAALTVLNNLGDASDPIYHVLETYPLESENLPHSRYRFDIAKLITDTLQIQSVDPRL